MTISCLRVQEKNPEKKIESFSKKAEALHFDI